MPTRSCSILISRSSSPAIRSNSAIMVSICATLRRLSSTRNLFRRMTVSRDFIDSYSPQAPNPEPHATARLLRLTERTRHCPSRRGVWRDTVSFRFPPRARDVAAGDRRFGFAVIAVGLNSVFTRVVNDCVTLWEFRGLPSFSRNRADRLSARLKPTLHAEDETPLGKKTTCVQYVRAIRRGRLIARVHTGIGCR